MVLFYIAVLIIFGSIGYHASAQKKKRVKHYYANAQAKFTPAEKKEIFKEASALHPNATRRQLNELVNRYCKEMQARYRELNLKTLDS